MPSNSRQRSADLRGALRLAADATLGLTDLVEAMHARIARVPGLGVPANVERTRGITGLVYRSVRGVTRVVGGSADVLLDQIALRLSPAGGAPSARREAVVAALNGVLGDHLARSGNPLAITMAFRRQGLALPLQQAALAAALPEAGPCPLVLVHGLCMNDLQWLREGHDHGAALARDLGYTPVYLHYNTGLHISANGLLLAQQLEQLLEAWPCEVHRLVLLTHSMGGLVARSAFHQATLAGLRWPGQLRDLVFLGTPHHGAPLERAGHWLELLLSAAPYAAPLARLGQVRSAGITDLRHGNLLESDWSGRSRFAPGTDRRQHLPLPRGVRCHAVAASTGSAHGSLKERLLGDGLVPLDSALGRHADPARTLAFAKHRQWVCHRVNHMELLSDNRVYARLHRWLA